MTNSWAHLFILSKAFFKEIKKKKSEFFVWTGSCSGSRKLSIAWDIVSSPKDHHGLEVFNIALLNLAAIGKLLWALFY